jgi:hypothetical protein
MDTEDLERKVKLLRAQSEKLLVSGDYGSYLKLHDAELYPAERELARTRGEEYAIPCELGVIWETGAPLPHLLCSGQRAFLIFIQRKIDPSWDGTQVTVKSPSSKGAESLALVEFHGATVKFGAPNDEVMSGHPLQGKGLMGYGAHYVMNSRWTRELEEINKVHPQYNPEVWKNLKHYLFAFHDETFECIADGHRVETHRTSLPDLVQIVARRMLSPG